MGHLKIWLLLMLPEVVFCRTLPKHVAEDPFVISVVTNGTYSIQVNNVTWLSSAPIFFHVGGKTYSTEDNSLKLNATTGHNGLDRLGQWQTTCYNMVAGASSIFGCFKTYISPNLPIVIFQQIFPDGALNTSTGDPDKVVSGFPSFQVPAAGPQLGYLSYGGLMFGDEKTLGVFTSDKAKLKSGLVSGPLVLFDKDNNVVITAPFSQFMAASMFQDGDRKRVSWGIFGGAEQLPVGYMYETIMYYSSDGINAAMSDWGSLMREYYGKDNAYRQSDLTLNYVGYWTDGGAYYYYNEEPGKNYEETILDVRDYAHRTSIPYRYVQFDSYFYPKGPQDGALTWVPMADLFPSGFQSLYDKTGWPSGAHNRYWSSKTTYAKQNGGRFDFIVEEATSKAIPIDQDFWDYLFETSREWGLTLYEQDWLNVEFNEMNVTLSDVSVGRTWLMQMGKGARKHGVTIQYCMSNPRHAMQSLEIPVVTQARVSGDYRAGADNWKIGISSIFADAMGIAPFKDTFWSTERQPGNPKYPDLIEPHSELQVIVSTLSTGPVAPGDIVNGTNVTLLMSCCNSDGLILQPSKPAMAIDSQMLQQAFQDGSGPDGEVYTTYSRIGEYVFGIILASAMEADFSLTPSAAGFDFFDPSLVFHRSVNQRTSVTAFSPSKPLTISGGCSRSGPCLYYTSPVFSVASKQVLLYGEEGKVVPISPKRVVQIDVSDDVVVTVRGAQREEVVFVFLENQTYIRVTCVIGSSGSADISFTNRQCSTY
ncbi:uncharacterized protein [Haliotis cracherodii]|uniref:uncharacterized protein n=1 Tax=Haliotis cracherodii TaxID=6455 RepID=UPI0039ED63A2